MMSDDVYLIVLYRVLKNSLTLYKLTLRNFSNITQFDRHHREKNYRDNYMMMLRMNEWNIIV